MAQPFQTSASMTPEQIFETVIKQKWFILIPLCISLTVGFILVLVVDRTYQASTLILVQPQRLPKEYVRSIVTTTIEQRVGTISQQILSRSNLEKTIDSFGLFEDQNDLYLEDKIAILRNRIKVKLERTRTGSDAFSISYKGESPERVMRITNALAAYFMDENLKVRESQAVGTSEFLDAELEKTKLKLEEYEKTLSNYRQKYIGGLPEELDSNLKTLDRLQMQLQNKQKILWEAKNQLNAYEIQNAGLKEQIQKEKRNSETLGGSAVADPNLTENGVLLEQARQQYENALTLYTARHPDVRKLAKRIEKLEKTVKEEKASSKETNESGSIDGVVTTVGPNREITNLLMQQEMEITEVKNDIRITQVEISQIEKQMKIYQKRVQNTPTREMELQAMLRNYQNIQDVYNSLLDRKLEAELSLNMEKKQKGEQFRIIDHARLPEKPISPNVVKFFVFAIAVGAITGGCIVFPLEYFDKSVKSERQVENDLNMSILATIPPLDGHIDKFKKRTEITLFLIVSVYGVFILGCFAILQIKGLDRTINLIKAYINL